MGGVTLQSACHAQLSHSHVDYPGECEDQLGIDNMIHNSNMSEEYVSTQCKMVLEMARCPFADCGEPVVPEGACCSICGKLEDLVSRETVFTVGGKIRH